MLYRLTFPTRLTDMELFFGRSSTWLSLVFNNVVTFLAERFQKLLQWHPMLTYDRIQQYAQALAPYTAGEEVIRGFLNRTFRGFCRPD